MIEIALKNINGKDVPAVTSLQVAESFEKEHKNVLRDIEAILPQVPEKFVKLNFELYEYPIETGIGTRMAKSYLLSKDAFTLLTMGYTGEAVRKVNALEDELGRGAKALGTLTSAWI